MGKSEQHKKQDVIKDQNQNKARIEFGVCWKIKSGEMDLNPLLAPHHRRGTGDLFSVEGEPSSQSMNDWVCLKSWGWRGIEAKHNSCLSDQNLKKRSSRRGGHLLLGVGGRSWRWTWKTKPTWGQQTAAFWLILYIHRTRNRAKGTSESRFNGAQRRA